MKIRVNNMLPLVVMLFLAGLTLWLRQTVEKPPGNEPAINNRDPDAIVDKLTLERLGTTGVAQYSMSARRMLHYLSDDSTVLEGPRFVKRGNDGITMTVTADRGAVTRNADEAFFYGNVLLQRGAAAGQPELQARTEYLHILADKDIVVTDRHVTITEGSRVLSGVGLEINRLTRQFSLHSKVKGHYDAARRK